MVLKGYDFRASLAYVMDPANHVFIDATPIYPTTDGHGLQSGWVTNAPEERDRDDTIDPRLAGLCFSDTNLTRTFRVTLPSTGSYQIRLALGDIFAHAGQELRVFDNTTEFITITAASNGAVQWIDASGVLRTSVADWVSNNVAVTRSFTSTTLNVQLGPGDGTTPTHLAHLSIEGDFVGLAMPFVMQLGAQVI